MTRLSVFFCFFCLFVTRIQAQQAYTVVAKDKHVKGEILFQLNENQSLSDFVTQLGERSENLGRDNIQSVAENLRIYAFHFDPNVYDEKKVLRS